MKIPLLTLNVLRQLDIAAVLNFRINHGVVMSLEKNELARVTNTKMLVITPKGRALVKKLFSKKKRKSTDEEE